MTKKTSKKNKKKLIKWQQLSLGAAVLLILVLALAIIIFASSLFENKLKDLKQSVFNPQENTKLEKGVDCLDCYINPLTGKEQKEEPGYPVAVVIDNHTDARPPAGINQAKIVYEAPVEAGITRLLAIYDSKDEIDKLGPIRSARPYFIDFSQAYSALFVHVGGSPEALVNIAKENVLNLNEFYQGSYFYRDNDRPAPHHVFSSMKNIRDYLLKNNISEAKFFTWKFLDEQTKIAYTENEQFNELINIDYLSQQYHIKWAYDWENGNYIRSVANDIYKDINNNVIRTKNLIIQEHKSEVLDDLLRIKINTIGEGKAVLCFNAICKEGVWKKDSAHARTRYYIKNKEIEFPSGNFWIEIVDQNVSYSY